MMQTLSGPTISVAHPVFLHGVECLVADRFATHEAGGLTMAARLFRLTKNPRESYRVRAEAASELAELIERAVSCLPDHHVARSATAVVHVPFSGSNRFAVRAVATGVSAALGIDVLDDVLAATHKQAWSKGAAVEAKQSMVGTFEARPGHRGPVVVVDDLVESGATFGAAAAALRSVGCRAVANVAAVALRC